MSRALWLVAQNELRAISRSRTLLLMGAIVSALLLISCLLGWQRHTEMERERSAFQALVRKQWLDQPDRHPHRVAHYGSFAFRPPGGLGAFDPGVDDYAGTTVYLEAHRRNPVSFSASSQDGSLLRFGLLSPAFILQTLVPLLIFCLAFRSVAGEREAGTFALLLAQGTSPRILIAGKVLSTVLATGMVLAPFTIIALAVLLGTRGASADLLARLALLGGSYGLYITACAAAAVAVSAWHQRSHAALITLAGAWILLWIVLPRGITAAAERIHPAPSQIELDLSISRALRDVGDSHNPEDPYFKDLRSRYLEQYGVERVEDLPVNFGGVVMREAEALTSQVQNAHHERLHASHSRQDRITLAAGLVAPLLAIRAWSMAIAGTDAAHAAEFQRQAEAHRYELIQALNEMHIHEIRAQNDRAQRIDRSRWKELPAFAYERPPLGWALSNAAIAGASLLLWAAGMLVLIVLAPALTVRQARSPGGDA